ncbi:TonB-dependent receptor [Aliiglaciecola sp. CAU 1673]|uniref:TonB-dependent receptor plug domain-containing protein n=1 Tax=Aliiglaciecola sp. CAU 1673 TaxID=3032595 RepID=UPI0023DA75CA|nr:TonB-dependent receptor [Aliiglaciecola sp. CAU 1673]MDF2176863.1 TonB-dependent receptor [Aliiglaciecola sp. CAU 1673]
MKTICGSLGLLAGLLSPLCTAHQKTPTELFDLSLEDLLDIQVVTSSRREQVLADAPGILSVVTREQIQAYGVTDLADVIELAPATLTTGTYMFPVDAVSVRGNMPGQYNTHVLILLDGYPLREMQNGGADLAVLRAFPIHQIQRVEFIRGPGSVQYGTNAFAGVINIITTQGQGASNSLALAKGNEGAGLLRLSAGDQGANWSAQLGLQYFADDQKPLTATDEAGNSFTRQFDQQNLGLHAKLQWQHWQLAYLYTRNESGHLGTLPLARLFSDDASIEAERHWFNVGGHVPLWQGEMTLALTYNGMHNQYVNPGPQPSYMDSDDWQLEASWQRQLTEQTQLIAGLEWQQNSGDSAGVHVRNGAVTIVPEYDATHSRAFLELTHQWHADLTLVGGIQWNKPEKSDGHYSARLSANYKLDPHWFVKLQFAEAYRAPSQLERDIALQGVVIGNPNLEPETIETWDLQLGYQRKDVFSAITLFHSKTDDLITRAAAPRQTASYFNLGSQTFKGFEWENIWNLADSGLRLEGSWSYQQNSQAGMDGDNISNMPRHLFKAGINYQWDHNLSLGVHYLLATAWSEPEGATARNPSPGQLDNLRAQLTYSVNEHLQWWISVENALDQLWWQPETTRRQVNTLPYYEQGSQWLAGLRYRF